VLVGTLALGLVSALFFGLLNGLLAGTAPVKKPNGRNRWSWRRMREHIGRAFINGVLVGLLIGVPYALTVLPPENRSTLLLTVAVVYALFGGAASLVIEGILGLQITEVRLTEIFTWSWARMGQQCLKFVGWGLLGLLLAALVIALPSGLYLWITGGAKTMLMIVQQVLNIGFVIIVGLGPFIVFFSGLLGAFSGGVSSNVLDERNLTRPNQGIRRSALYSIVIGTMSMMIGGAVGVLFASITRGALTDINSMLTYGAIFGILTGLVNGLRNGGIACIQHIALRWLQRETDSVPWKYAHFLDYAAERVLLRKVGGGYVFIHRLLLDYFASL